MFGERHNHMRLNRKIRIGAAIVAAALLLLGMISIVNRARTRQSPEAAAERVAQNTAVQPVSLGSVAVARADIPERTIITPEMLELRELRSGEDADAFVTDISGQAAGYITLRAVTAGRELRRSDLVGHISDVGIAGALLPGRRAMIVPIPNKSTLHDLVRVGDRIDLVASFDQQEARTIIQDVRVLAVDVFGKDFPQVKIAMRGDYKASPRSFSAANAPSPGENAPATAPGTVNPDSPEGAAQGQAPPAGAAPQPTATSGPAPARPEPALTVEVTPEQATTIALAQSAGQNLDFLLRPRNEPGAATGTAAGAAGVTLASGETTLVAASTTRAQLAPYAERVKRSGANAGGQAGRAAGTGSSAGLADRSPSRTSGSGSYASSRRRDSGSSGFGYSPPSIPAVDSVPPARLDGASRIGGSAPDAAPAPPQTYDIPVYADGKLVRVETVKKPND
jgi:Flp pilus assembly protein CpaB